ncbi:MAG: hypothetical protein ACREC4_01510 [Methylocella sp.]
MTGQNCMDFYGGGVVLPKATKVAEIFLVLARSEIGELAGKETGSIVFHRGFSNENSLFASA